MQPVSQQAPILNRRGVLLRTLQMQSDGFTDKGRGLFTHRPYGYIVGLIEADGDGFRPQGLITLHFELVVA